MKHHAGGQAVEAEKEKIKPAKEKGPAKAKRQTWEQREGFEYRVYDARGSRPPGWSRGKKTGWGDCGVPPGQAKKGECRTYVYQGRHYFYYRDEDGRIVVRRAMPAPRG